MNKILLLLLIILPLHVNAENNQQLTRLIEIQKQKLEEIRKNNKLLALQIEQYKKQKLCTKNDNDKR